jgi:tetratricopeptide (TPR) repeat protein
MRHTKTIQGLFVMLPLSGCASGQLASWLPATDPRIDQAPMRADSKIEARAYFRRPNPKAFAFSPEKGTYWAAWGRSSAEAAKKSTLHDCEERTGAPCILFAVNNQIVWRPGGERPTAGALEDKPRATSVAPERVAVAPHAANPVSAPATGPAPASEDDLDRTIQDYSQTLILAPDDKTAIEALYIAYIRRAAAAELRDEVLALADYSRAIELKPTASFAYKRRGQLQLERGAAAAVADLTRAQELEPGEAAIAKLLAGAQQAVAVASEAAAEVPPPAARVAVHVASVRDPAEVPGEWQRLAKRYQVLAGLEPQTPRKVEVPGKGIFYRVIGGAFAARAEAQAVCDRLRSAGGYCTIVVL